MIPKKIKDYNKIIEAERSKAVEENEEYLLKQQNEEDLLIKFFDEDLNDELLKYPIFIGDIMFRGIPTNTLGEALFFIELDIDGRLNNYIGIMN